MTMTGWMTIKEIEKKYKYFTDNSIKCKCGHSLLITSKDGKALCTHCHRYVFANEEIERNYRREEFKKTIRREL